MCRSIRDRRSIKELSYRYPADFGLFSWSGWLRNRRTREQIRGAALRRKRQTDDGSKDKTNVVTVPAMRPTMLKCPRFCGQSGPFMAVCDYGCNQVGWIIMLICSARLISDGISTASLLRSTRTLTRFNSSAASSITRCRFSRPRNMVVCCRCSIPTMTQALAASKIVDSRAQVLHEQQYKINAHSSALVSMHTDAIGYKQTTYLERSARQKG